MSSLKIDCVNTPKKLLYHRVRIKYYNVICESCKGCWGVPKWLSATSWNFGTLTPQQTFVLMKTSWRRLWSSSSEDVFKTSSSRPDQDEYIRLTHTSSEDVFKTSSSRPTYSSWPYVFKMFWKRLQDIFKTFSRLIIKLNCSW